MSAGWCEALGSHGAGYRPCNSLVHLQAVSTGFCPVVTNFTQTATAADTVRRADQPVILPLIMSYWYRPLLASSSTGIQVQGDRKMPIKAKGNMNLNGLIKSLW